MGLPEVSRNYNNLDTLAIINYILLIKVKCLQSIKWGGLGYSNWKPPPLLICKQYIVLFRSNWLRYSAFSNNYLAVIQLQREWGSRGWCPSKIPPPSSLNLTLPGPPHTWKSKSRKLFSVRIKMFLQPVAMEARGQKVIHPTGSYIMKKTN